VCVTELANMKVLKTLCPRGLTIRGVKWYEMDEMLMSTATVLGQQFEIVKTNWVQQRLGPMIQTTHRL